MNNRPSPFSPHVPAPLQYGQGDVLRNTPHISTRIPPDNSPSAICRTDNLVDIIKELKQTASNFKVYPSIYVQPAWLMRSALRQRDPSGQVSLPGGVRPYGHGTQVAGLSTQK